MGKRECSLAYEIDPSNSFIPGRGEEFCRGCLGTNLFSALDLGNLPIANELLYNEKSEIEKFSLHLRICASCGLGQVADVVPPERIFRDYRYLSSMSKTFLDHARNFVETYTAEHHFSPQDWVLEIASNDGYLLRNFLPLGIKVIGIEPAENVAAISRKLGLHTITEFFSSELASQLLLENGYPKLIIANNVMAHVPSLTNFIKGLSILCGPDTKISVENPSLANILLGMQFDTIYHEHYSYLSAKTVSTLSSTYGLQLIKVEELSIHGGSNRYWISKYSENRIADESVQRMIQFEVESGLFDFLRWGNYAEQVSRILREFQSWLVSTKSASGRIFGYGAAAKASTILNSIDVAPGFIEGIADISLEKQSRFMPPNGIKIISPSSLFNAAPTDIVIFPWNIKSEIAHFLKLNLKKNTRIWCVVPEMKQVTE
jgi:2-polyprenyl-3-methyl-5-hydroxy-6-metoxy-1,4-benzoquinol methylase